MSDPARSGDEIEWLEQELRHATAIAACSIGQPDRAENVRYREHIAAKLHAARAAAEELGGVAGD